jgi:hypothetical protein
MRFKIMFALVLGLAACGGGDGGNGDDSGGDDGGGGGGGSTCAEVIDCANECSTDACADECVEDASSDAQELILDLANCITESGCQDAECLATECGNEIDACYADSGD